MGATLYAALIMHSYVMSLICCGIQVRLHCVDASVCTTLEPNRLEPRAELPAVQVVALLYYLTSYFPGEHPTSWLPCWHAK